MKKDRIQTRKRRHNLGRPRSTPYPDYGSLTTSSIDISTTKNVSDPIISAPFSQIQSSNISSHITSYPQHYQNIENIILQPLQNGVQSGFEKEQNQKI